MITDTTLIWVVLLVAVGGVTSSVVYGVYVFLVAPILTGIPLGWVSRKIGHWPSIIPVRTRALGACRSS